jgi:hypothetical protein
MYLSVKFIDSSVNQIKKNEMGEARGTCGRGEMCIQCFDGDTCGKVTIWNTYAKIGG